LFAGIPGNNRCETVNDNCFNYPMGINLDLSKENNESLIVADYFNSVVRKIPLSTNHNVLTFGKFKATPMCNPYPVNTSSTVYFNKPYDVTVSSNGDIYVAEDISSSISVLRNGGQGLTDIIAGICPRDSKFQDGSCRTARLAAPYSLSIDGNNLYFADNGRIRVAELVPGVGCSNTSNINIRTIFPLNNPNQNFKAIKVSYARKGEGPIFIADSKEGNIKALTLDEKLTPLTSNFSSVNEPMALTVDGKGNIFIAANNRIYVLYTDGKLIPLAGTGNAGYANGTDGDALTSKFSKPSGLALYDAKGILFVADTYNHVIRKVIFQ
jgi:hypothetical protein